MTNPSSNLAAMCSISSTTGNQVTTYTYGTTLTESGVARNDLLRNIAYPDSSGSTDRAWITYNRLGQETTRTDQRGTVRSFDYDKLGRLLHDRVTTVGSDEEKGSMRKRGQSILTTYIHTETPHPSRPL